MANVMTKRGTQDNVVTYEHICDKTADLANIDPKLTNLGSTALVVDGDEGMEFYIADSEKKWIPVTSGGGGGVEPTGSVTLTANGTYNVKSKAQAVVAVPPYGEGSVNIDTNGVHNVSGKATAIINVSYAPPSGTINITENGEYNVTDKAHAVVAVPQPSGSISITQNGTYNVTNKAEAVVDVPDSTIYGSFTISRTADNLVGFSTMAKFRAKTTDSYNINMPVMIKTSTSDTFTGRWPLQDDGYMYVIFGGSSPAYWPSVSATTGTATAITNYNSYGSIGTTFFNFPSPQLANPAPWGGQYVIYKISDGAVLTVTHINNA